MKNIYRAKSDGIRGYGRTRRPSDEVRGIGKQKGLVSGRERERESNGDNED